MAWRDTRSLWLWLSQDGGLHHAPLFINLDDLFSTGNRGRTPHAVVVAGALAGDAVCTMCRTGASPWVATLD